jgi:hypothetical protein
MSPKELEPKSELFYLGFNKDTGELEHVIPPSGHKLILKPDEHKNYKKKNLSGEKKQKFEQQHEHIEYLINKSKDKFEEQKLKFADHPGNSVCGGSCGGIPFSWCPYI